MGDVDVVLRKFDGRPHRRTTTRHLGEDEDGHEPDVVERAAAAASYLRTALAGDVEPFASRYRTSLERL